MIRIIKEAVIILLICLVGMLLFAVVFYKYIPNRKVIPDVEKYEASEKVSAQLADNVDNSDENQRKTYRYEVTSNDLNNYIIKNDYVPGKANPFAEVSEDPESNTITVNPDNPDNPGKPNNNTIGGNTITTNETSDEPITK